jgi:hypothetical protein
MVMVMVLERTQEFQSAGCSHYSSALKIVRSDAVWG